MKKILCYLFLAAAALAQPPVDYVYKAKVLAITDGDTAEVLVDLGFNVFSRQKLRLRDVYAAEKRAPNGAAHTAALAALMPVDSAVIVRTTKDSTDRYGRIVAELWHGTTNVNESMRVTIGAPQGTGVPK